jgi:hypothetical protein
MQKVVGSVSLQIATFREIPRDFSATVCARKRKRFAELATARAFGKKKPCGLQGLLRAADGTRTHDLLLAIVSTFRMNAC